MERTPASVLFVCNLNTIRSPMAVGLMQLRFGRAIWADSCGARGGGALAPDPFMLAVMDEAGVDMSGHRPKTFEALNDLNFDLIVTLTPEAHHWALEVTRTLAAAVEYWPAIDPSLAQGAREQMLDEYRAVRDALDARIARRFARD